MATLLQLHKAHFCLDCFSVKTFYLQGFCNRGSQVTGAAARAQRTWLLAPSLCERIAFFEQLTHMHNYCCVFLCSYSQSTVPIRTRLPHFNVWAARLVRVRPGGHQWSWSTRMTKITRNLLRKTHYFPTNSEKQKKDEKRVVHQDPLKGRSLSKCEKS